MIVEEHKQMDQIQKLDLPHFVGDPVCDAQDFLDTCHKISRNLGLVDSNEVDFTTFYLRSQPKDGGKLISRVGK